MALCLLHLLECVLLLLNAAAVLNAERFLRKLRLHSVSAAAAAASAAVFDACFGIQLLGEAAFGEPY